MFRSATLAMDVSSTVMKVAIDRIRMTSQGLCFPAAERLASQLIGERLLIAPSPTA